MPFQNRTVGSNPSLSASKSIFVRKSTSPFLDSFRFADHPGVDAIFVNTSAFMITETPGRRRGGFS